MKQTKLLTHLLLLVALLAVTVGSQEDKNSDRKQSSQKKTNHEKVDWMAYDVGLTKAKTEDKHIFIDFTAEWCGWCRKMEKETFSRPEVIEMLNTNFVPVRVDGDSKHELNIDGYKVTEKDLMRFEYRVSGLPSYWFLKPDGTKLAVIRGYKPAEYMMEAFEYIKDYKYDTTRTETPDKKEKKKD